MLISVFSNDGRFPVQFELSGQSQIYRFRHSENLKGLPDVKALIDDAFIAGVLRQFNAMQALQSDLIDRNTPTSTETDTDGLPDIF